MNSTINTNASTWKSIKARYVALACGLALAASAVVVGAPWQTSPGRDSRFSSPLPAHLDQSQVTSPQSLYFLVSSEAEAARWEAILGAESYIHATPIYIHVMVVNTPDQQAMITEVSRELTQYGANFSVVDLRTQPTSPGSPAPDERPISQSSSQLDADIMASVISTEHSTRAFDEVQPARQASDEDIRASVISTERAVWGITDVSTATALQ
jgi:hypothetical protein